VVFVRLITVTVFPVPSYTATLPSASVEPDPNAALAVYVVAVAGFADTDEPARANTILRAPLPFAQVNVKLFGARFENTIPDACWAGVKSGFPHMKPLRFPCAVVCVTTPPKEPVTFVVDPAGAIVVPAKPAD